MRAKSVILQINTLKNTLASDNTIITKLRNSSDPQIKAFWKHIENDLLAYLAELDLRIQEKTLEDMHFQMIQQLALALSGESVEGIQEAFKDIPTWNKQQEERNKSDAEAKEFRVILGVVSFVLTFLLVALLALTCPPVGVMPLAYLTLSFLTIASAIFSMVTMFMASCINTEDNRPLKSMGPLAKKILGYGKPEEMNAPVVATSEEKPVSSGFRVSLLSFLNRCVNKGKGLPTVEAGAGNVQMTNHSQVFGRR